MKLEAFEYNLRNKTVPLAQSITMSDGAHVPMIFTYDKEGNEMASALSELFDDNSKDVIFSIIEQYLDDTNAKAFVLITEAYMKQVSKKDYESMTDKQLDMITKLGIADDDEALECLTITWGYKNETKGGGVISCPLLKQDGMVVIDYENIVDSCDEDSQTRGRATNLLK